MAFFAQGCDNAAAIKNLSILFSVLSDPFINRRREKKKLDLKPDTKHQAGFIL